VWTVCMSSGRELQVSGATLLHCTALITWTVAMRLLGCKLIMTGPGSIELSWLAHLVTIAFKCRCNCLRYMIGELNST
jgi:hypothetical protein